MSDTHGPLPYATPPPRPRRLGLWIVGVSMLVGVMLALIGLMFFEVEVRYEARGSLIVTPAPAAPVVQPVVPPATPSRVTLAQRTQQPLPGSNGTVLLRIGDITRGQTVATITDINGQTLLSVPMRQGERQSFRVRGIPYQLELIRFRNVLVGEDTAVFQLSAPTAAPTPNARSVKAGIP